MADSDDAAPETTSEESPSAPQPSIARKIVAMIVAAPALLVGLLGLFRYSDGNGPKGTALMMMVGGVVGAGALYGLIVGTGERPSEDIVETSDSQSGAGPAA